ncbi:MAG: arginine decarboxylase [Bacteroidales bacterium]|jgi:arginine decarboxylase|nr:arginine decarboxylase [Bacteroidales bacterium]
MKIKYIDLIEKTFDFPQPEFELDGENLLFHKIPLMDIIEKYGAPLKFTYLPQISNQIQKAKSWFKNAMEKVNYKSQYHYCYCTKSSHFKHVLHEALKNDIHIETSSAYDINIIEALLKDKKLTKSTYIICNGFKRDAYIENIARLINTGYNNTIPIIDNYKELDRLEELIDVPYQVGIRIASEEEPKFEFYTSRLGIGYKNIVNFYLKQIKDNPNVKLKMLHFFINTGIKDNAYYWSELVKCLNVYGELKKVCPELDSLNIGGGFPIKNSLSFDYDYEYMIDEIVSQIKIYCETNNLKEPNIFTEFGSFTVGESGGTIYSILGQKKQNDREVWNMIDSSFMTTLPDSWAINKRFVMLPINKWHSSYEKVFLGGLTCDSDDYYKSEHQSNALYLPKYNSNEKLYIGFFNTGAYQDTLGGFKGLQHCLIPGPKQIIIDIDKEGNFTTTLFSEEQEPQDMLKILGY